MRCIFAHEISHDYPDRPAGTGNGIDSVPVVIAARDDSLFLVMQEGVILRPWAAFFPVPTFFPRHGYPSLSTMTGTPGPEQVSPLCRVCIHLHRGAGLPSCDAFPGGIPDAIRAGERHVDPYPGDGGIVFRKTSGEASFFIVEAQPGILFRVTAAGSYERYVPILDLWDLDNRFIGYVLSVPFPFWPVDASDAEAFMESSRECLDAMNPCMREVRRMMYLQSRKDEVQ